MTKEQIGTTVERSASSVCSRRALGRYRAWLETRA
jgi:hypothetical protein